MHIYERDDGGDENGDVKEGREWRLLGLLYADDLVLCGESEENLRTVVGCFVEVFKRRGLKVNAGKSEVMVLGEEEGLKYEVCIDGIRLEHLQNLNTWDVFWTNRVQMRVASGSTVVGAIRSLVNARSLQLDCAKVLDESLLVPVLTYGSETVIWKEEEMSRIRAVQMDNLRDLLGIRRM